ncbi:glycosyltransferase [Haladaptatus sp. DYF46]|uniref:glycosyltransferase n=1 Tax=Haladaptatus sp. DYF46 TaxID=2886041 RepID=UPI001E4A4E03|nr:glycosyltransferase [Haladaptatus sp. DYF46]
MAKITYVTSSIVGPSTVSSSIAKYQFPKFLTAEHSTTVLSRTPIQEPEITTEATVKTPPGNAYVRAILFPFFVVFHLLRSRGETDLVASDRSGDAILPVAIFHRLGFAPWVVFCADSPDGRENKRGRADLELDVSLLHTELMQRIAWYGYRNADRVILSDESSEIADSRKTVIKGGVDCETVERVTETTERTESDAVRVLYVGNMYYHRAIDVLFDAFDHCESDVELVLVGPSPEGGDANNLQEFVEHVAPSLEARIESLPVNCEYKGKLPHEAALAEMVDADIGMCLLPYERGMPHFLDSYPIKIFEYMATGNAVVATRTPATSELLDDPQLVRENDPEAVADTIDSLADDGNLREQCQTRNREVVESHCWGTLWNRIDDEIESVIENDERTTPMTEAQTE